ncbi:MAG: 5-(carboxyamino)imidazole ribonucleotide mutase [Verrucomicrobia bacterium]|nr:MAG: 5-(carboxyamino)imidazole ribonucleotide mutase [Verrucomicrobiota bacterium]
MSETTTPLVAVLMGSQSDWETMQACHQTLDQFGIPHVCRVLSAHRTPEQTTAFVKESDAAGTEVFIAAAGGAAHLAGVVAAHTVKPVIGVPMTGWAVQGLDALLSTVQMPPGIPVATVAIGKPGAINAALLAVSILGVKRPELLDRLRAHREEQARKILGQKLV